MKAMSWKSSASWEVDKKLMPSTVEMKELIPAYEPLKLGHCTITNRLIVGTGKYENYEIMRQALDRTDAQVVTVAVRRERLVDADGRSILDFIDTDR